MSESVRQLWILSLNTSASIHQAMTNVSALNMKSSEQHVEMGVSRRSTDYLDYQKNSRINANKKSFLTGRSGFTFFIPWFSF